MHVRQPRRVPMVVGMGILLSMVVHLWTIGPSERDAFHVLGIVLTIAGSGFGSIVLGARYEALPSPDAERTRLGVWMTGSALLFLAVGVVTVFLGSAAVTASELVEVLHVNGSVGLFVGLVMGVLESRQIASAENAAREAARATALREERERTRKLNDLLRHYVLNGVAVIDGFAASIAERSPEHEAEVETIRHRADSMAVLVQNVRALTADGSPDTSLRQTSIRRALTRAVDSHGDDVEVSMPDEEAEIEIADTFVDGMSLLVDALYRLVDADAGSVRIGCRVDREAVRISASGQPGALSEPLRESAFEPVTAGVGLQLYLVSEMIGESGAIDVRDTGADSVTVAFEISVPRADEGTE